MAFIPKTLRLLSPAAAEPVTRATVAAEGLRMAMSYAGLNNRGRIGEVEQTKPTGNTRGESDDLKETNYQGAVPCF